MYIKLGFIFELMLLCSSETVPRLRGVSLSMISLYSTEGSFTCLDGSLTIPFDQVNDDYCDCISDGSDEPGTAACPNGNFFCNNVGHKPEFIPSSRVSDGICDCCDGSDEYATNITCEDNCFELGQAAREEEARKLAMFKEGNKIRKELCAKGKQLKKEKQLKLLDLSKEQSEAELLKNEKENIKQKVEEKEKVALETHRLLEEQKRKLIEEEERKKSEHEASKLFIEIDDNGDGYIDIIEVSKVTFLDNDNDGVISENEIKSVLGEEEKVSFEQFFNGGWQYITQLTIARNMKAEQEAEVQSSENASRADIEDAETTELPKQDVYGDNEDEEDKEDKEDVNEDAESHEEEDAEITGTDESKIEYDEETKQIISEAEEARTEFENASRNLRDIQREMKQTEESLNKDYGKEDEFAYLVGECFEYTDREYTYKLCPFDQVSQRPKDGGIETRLGSWGNWVGDNHEFMFYGHGQSCWNGPQRQTHVKLSCNLRTEVVGASEPNRCEYLLELNTPAACIWKELEEGTSRHDEL